MLDNFNTNSKKIITILFLLCSFIFISITIYNLQDPEKLATKSDLMTRIVDDCGNEATKLGFKNVKTVNINNKKLVVIRQEHIDDGIDVAYKSAMLMSYCKKMELTNFCLGDGCTFNKKPLDFRMELEIKI